MNSSTPPFPVDSLEYRMFRAMRQTIEKITLERNGLREIQQSHYLNGTFRQLCDSATMVEVLYPGASADVLRNMPKNLKELLEWLDLELDLRELSVKAVEVLTNIKAKGAAKGEFMDKETENVLIPQISQESLSKGIIDAVRKLNRKVSATVASRMKLVADPESEKATKNQLLETTISFLIKEKFSFQQNFFGQDWVNYARKDVERFVKYEKMSAIDSQGNVMPKSSCVDESCGVNYICWIELDSFLKENYPALAEVVEELHCLPYELNGIFYFLFIFYYSIVLIVSRCLSKYEFSFVPAVRTWKGGNYVDLLPYRIWTD